MRRVVPAALAFVLLFASGCERAAPPPPKGPIHPSGALSPGQIALHIDSTDPTSFALSGNDLWIGTMTVNYTTHGVKPDDKLELELYNTATRVIARTDVPVQEHGQYYWNVGAHAQVGPTIRVRVICPNYATDWAVLGLMHQAASSAPIHIDNLTPNPLYEHIRTDGPIPFTIWGDGFEQGCTAEANVANGSSIPMTTTYGGPKRLFATLDTADLHFNTVSERYVQLKLVLRPQKGGAREDVAYLDITDQ